MKSLNRAIIYLRNYFWPALGTFVSLLLVNAANLISPQLLRTLIDVGISELKMSVVWHDAICI